MIAKLISVTIGHREVMKSSEKAMHGAEEQGTAMAQNRRAASVLQRHSEDEQGYERLWHIMALRSVDE